MVAEVVADDELFLEEAHLALRRRVEDLGDRLSAADPLGLLAAERLLGLALPEDAQTPDLRSLCVIQAALSRSSMLAGQAFEAQVRAGHLLHLAGGDEHQECLGKIRAGTLVAALATGEQGADDALEASTSARRENGTYVLNGTKTFVRSAGPAGLLVVLARTGEGDKGLTFFLVEAGQNGVACKKQALLGDGEIIDVHLTDCSVSEASRLGREGEGRELAERSRLFLAPMAGAAALGLGTRVLDESLAHLRHHGEAGSRPAVPQGTQHALADMATELEGGRLLIERAAAEMDAGRGRPDLASMAQLFAVEAAGNVVDRAVQIRGEAALLEGSVLQGLFRGVRSRRFAWGTTANHRDRIARESL